MLGKILQSETFSLVLFLQFFSTAVGDVIVLTPSNPDYAASPAGIAFEGELAEHTIDVSSFSGSTKLTIFIADFFPPQPDDYDIYLNGQLLGNTLTATGRTFEVIVPPSASLLQIDYVNHNTGLPPDPGGSGYDLFINASRAITVSSSDAASSQVVNGSVQDQILQLNSTPPTIGFGPVNRHADLHEPASFVCDDPPDDPLNLPYVATLQFMDDIDEVTLDNCSSAWYRFAFELPENYENAFLSGSANVDDAAVLYLNGNRISAALLATDLGVDRLDADGRPLLSWPTTDSFSASNQDFFVAGTNELVFGVIGDLSDFEPTGLEFEACISFESPAQHFLINGSFESPIVPEESFTTFIGGAQGIPGWTVEGNEVTIVDSTFTQNGIEFNAHEGQQWLDLSGVANPSPLNGVSQDIATTVGARYALNFFIGSATDGTLFFPSTVDLSIDGGPRLSFTNDEVPTDMLDWKSFTHVFSAQGNITTISFLNGSESTNFLSALDNVSIREFILGDVNGDGEVNLLDVSPFIDLLSSDEFMPEADINLDGAVNLLDVAPFVALLSE